MSVPQGRKYYRTNIDAKQCKTALQSNNEIIGNE